VTKKSLLILLFALSITGGELSEKFVIPPASGNAKLAFIGNADNWLRELVSTELLPREKIIKVSLLDNETTVNTSDERRTTWTTDKWVLVKNA
jgi:hypothetical protein